MDIRKARIEDKDEIFVLLNQLYENKIKYEIFSKIYETKWNNENSYYIVAINDNKIIGVLIMEIFIQLHRAKKTSFVDDLIVKEEYRNNGIGKLLLQNAISYAKQQDCEVIELTSFLLNENAHRFYENNGFKKHSIKFKQYL